MNQPPRILLIAREFIKPGRKAEVFNIERDSVKQQTQLKSPHSYRVLSSTTGPDVLLWLNPGDSYDYFEKTQAKVAQIPGLLEEWARTPTLKADLISESRQFFARRRDDLSYGHGLDLGGMRYFLVTTVTVQPGRRAEFFELRKLIKRSHERDPVNAAVYEVESGMPDGCFIIFSSAPSLVDAGALSEQHARDSENARGNSSIASSETALFTMSPEISMRTGQTAK